MVSTNTRLGPEPMYAAMVVVIEQGLRQDGSAFTPGVPVWTGENFAALKARFVDHPDTGAGTFIEKPQGQLSGASDPQIQLMAELMYVHLLISSAITGAKKRSTIDEILGMGTSPITIPSDLAVALDEGAVNPGTFFNTGRDRQLSFLVRFGLDWKSKPREAQDAALDDPWKFDEFLATVELASAFTQREALKHLVHPAAFEAISSQEHKKRLVGALGDLVDPSLTHVDRQIASIRKSISSLCGDDFDFYSPPASDLWRDSGWKWPEAVRWGTDFYQSPDFEEEEVTYKLEAATKLEESLKRFLKSGDTAGLAGRFTSKNLVSWRPAASWVDWAEKHPAEGAKSVRAAWAAGTAKERIDGFLAFVPADLITGSGSRASLAATVAFAENPSEFPIFRITMFQAFAKKVGADAPTDKASPGEWYGWALRLLDTFRTHLSLRKIELPDRLHTQGLVWAIMNWDSDDSRLSEWTDEDAAKFLTWRGDRTEEDIKESTEIGSEILPLDVSGSIDDLAESLYLDPAWIRRMVKLLDHRPQLVFQGPPGTGKTYVALKLAEFMAGGTDAVTLVQFHPSYSYEDFVQGWRPTDGGFALTDGPLITAAQRAEATPDRTHVMVIDELNRGDVAKIFGELFFLLEYRDHEIQLQYGGGPFQLPPNLKFICTMNTADRSIAIVDGALRRRFHFVSFTPSDPPVSEVLRSWLERHKPTMSWVADVVDLANKELGDPDLAVGPSHFMDDDLDADLVKMVWEHSVLPYIAEQLFGQRDRLLDFRLDTLRRRVDAEADGGDDTAN